LQPASHPDRPARELDSAGLAFHSRDSWPWRGHRRAIRARLGHLSARTPAGSPLLVERRPVYPRVMASRGFRPLTAWRSEADDGGGRSNQSAQGTPWRTLHPELAQAQSQMIRARARLWRAKWSSHHRPRLGLRWIAAGLPYRSHAARFDTAPQRSRPLIRTA
jgi:hypothetical protein